MFASPFPLFPPVQILILSLVQSLDLDIAKCDRVIRTLFIGSTVELDDWEVLCRDRNSYSLTITPEQTAHIHLLVVQPAQPHITFA